MRQHLGFRPLSQQDAPTIYRHTHRDASFYRRPLITPPPATEDAVRDWIARHENNPSSHYTAVTLDDHPVGAVGLTKIRPSLDAELTYWIAESYRRRGLAHHAIDHIHSIADEHDIPLLYAYVDQDNKISAHLLERHGYTPEPDGSPFPDQDVYVKHLIPEREQTLNTALHSSSPPCYEPTPAESYAPRTRANR